MEGKINQNKSKDNLSESEKGWTWENASAVDKFALGLYMINMFKGW